jgi:ABC-2 type transport system permease protein
MPIFDQGYQHWTGELAGHGWRWLAITRRGVRAGLKNRWVRYVLYLACLPALMLAAFLCMWGLLEQNSRSVSMVMQMLTFVSPKIVADPYHYRMTVWTLAYSFFFWAELRFSMMLILLVGPQLISQDLRFNALPLYFSRPLRRLDYFLGKLGVIAAFLAMVVIVPSIVAYLLGLLFSLDRTIVPQTFRLLLSSVVYGAIITLSAGLLILALSSLSRNSRYVTLMWLAVWIVSGIVASTLQGVQQEQRRHAYFARRQMGMQMPADMTHQQRREWVRTMMQQKGLQEEEIAAGKTDWRPLISYTDNLSRVGQTLLGTPAAWRTLDELQPEDSQAWFLAQYEGPQYPWIWSAGVLAALFGLSACTMNIPIKSLDRLK